jgi:hypothetical protein
MQYLITPSPSVRRVVIYRGANIKRVFDVQNPIRLGNAPAFVQRGNEIDLQVFKYITGIDLVVGVIRETPRQAIQVPHDVNLRAMGVQVVIIRASFDVIACTDIQDFHKVSSV